MEIKDIIIIKGFMDKIDYTTNKTIYTDLSKNKLIQEFIPKTNYIPVKGDRLYFIPGCNIPRFKVKKFCEKTNTTVVKYRDKATVKFIGHDSIENYFGGGHFMYFDTKKIINHIIKYMHVDMSFYDKHAELLNVLINSEQPYVGIEYGAVTYLGTGMDTLDTDMKYDAEEHDNVETPDFIFYKGGYELYNELCLSTDIYNQDELLKYINEDNVMGKDEYISIQRLFNSTDNQNKLLAMETMANCDYTKSAVFLLLLIKDFGDIIYNQRTKTHVNFKSMIKYFDIDSLISFNTNRIVNCLINKKLLNKQNLDMLMPIISEDFINCNSSEHFAVKTINYNENVEKALVENILDKTNDTIIYDEDEEELNPKF